MPKRYMVEITRKAQEELRKLDRQVQPSILDAIDALKKDPRPHAVGALRGSSFYRIRVGDYRVIYDIEDDRLLVLVVRVRHRRDAYR